MVRLEGAWRSSQTMKPSERLRGIAVLLVDDNATPAIAYTAYDTYRAEALRAGFAVYLIKPIDPATFVDEVARLARPRP